MFVYHPRVNLSRITHHGKERRRYLSWGLYLRVLGSAPSGGTLFFAWNGIKSIFSIATIEQINRWSIALPKCALALAPLLIASPTGNNLTKITIRSSERKKRSH
jgi:hypothetical protein